MNGMFERRADKRRRDRSTRSKIDLVKLNERHQEILNLSMLGMKDVQIAEALKVTPVTVSNTKNSTLGQQKMAMMRGARDADTVDVAKRMQEIIPKALAVYEKILTEETGENELAHGGASITLQKQTADMVLREFSGLAVPKKMLVGHAHVTPQFIEELKEQGKKAAAECGLIFEGEVIKEASGG